MSILVVSHTAKATAGSQTAHAMRGASAIADNCRFVVNLSHISKEESVNLGLPENECVKLVHTKSSYAAPQQTVFFRRCEHGVPVMIDRAQINNERLGNALDMLIEVLRKDWPNGIGKRDLERVANDGRIVRNLVLKEVDLPKSLWGEVVRLGLESGRLDIFPNPNSGGNNAAKLIRPMWPGPVSTGKFSTGMNWQKNELAS